MWNPVTLMTHRTRLCVRGCHDLRKVAYRNVAEAALPPAAGRTPPGQQLAARASHSHLPSWYRQARGRSDLYLEPISSSLTVAGDDLSFWEDAVFRTGRLSSTFAGFGFGEAAGTSCDDARRALFVRALARRLQATSLLKT